MMLLRKHFLLAMLTAAAVMAACHSIRLLQPSRAGNRRQSASLLPVQFSDPNNLGVGKVLVASRGLGDPNFARSVILLVRYDEKGVVGLMLNRRTDVPLSKVLNLKSARDRSDPAWLGGPMDPSVAFALYQSPGKIDKSESIFPGVCMITERDQFEQTIATQPDQHIFHVYLGYAGWTEDQLQAEVKLGAWFVFPANANSIFNSDPDSLWQKMIENTQLLQAKAGLVPTNFL